MPFWKVGVEGMPLSSMDARDLTIPSADGLRLSARWWAVPEPRATIIVAHGFGEHGGTYAQLAGIVGGAVCADFFALDFRGHGRSPGRRGVVRRYEDLVTDLRSMVVWAGTNRPDL